uniref:Uncharacterized protein n=1 Tax=viral metagenome TaxID=1070528 RepID=A0A6C0B5K6_9ZZZZ
MPPKKESPKQSLTDIINHNSENLFHAARKGNITRIEKLLEKGNVDINWACPEVKYYKETPLMAIINNNKKNEDVVKSTVQYLIDNGANINQRTAYGYTPLYYAVMRNSVSLVQLLLSNGADPNITNNNKDTPLHTAIEKQNQRIIDSLLIAGADADIIENMYNRTARQHSMNYPHINVDTKTANTLKFINVMKHKGALNRLDFASLDDFRDYSGGKTTKRRRTNKRKTNKKQ